MTRINRDQNNLFSRKTEKEVSLKDKPAHQTSSCATTFSRLAPFLAAGAAIPVIGWKIAAGGFLAYQGIRLIRGKLMGKKEKSEEASASFEKLAKVQKILEKDSKKNLDENRPSLPKASPSLEPKKESIPLSAAPLSLPKIEEESPIQPISSPSPKKDIEKAPQNPPSSENLYKDGKLTAKALFITQFKKNNFFIAVIKSVPALLFHGIYTFFTKRSGDLNKAARYAKRAVIPGYILGFILAVGLVFPIIGGILQLAFSKNKPKKEGPPLLSETEMANLERRKKRLEAEKAPKAN